MYNYNIAALQGLLSFYGPDEPARQNVTER